MRAFVEKEITPFCNDWDEAKKIPRELFVKAYQARLYDACARGWTGTTGEKESTGGGVPRAHTVRRRLQAV